MQKTTIRGRKLSQVKMNTRLHTINEPAALLHIYRVLLPGGKDTIK